MRAVPAKVLTPLLALFIAAAAVAAPTVNVAAHGKRTTIGKGDSAITVLYLKGTPYEMGYAYGALCKPEVRYMAGEVAERMISGMDQTHEQIDAVWQKHSHHMRKEYLEEIQGLADGSGIAVSALQRIHSVPDISEWHCTFFGAVGPAAAGREPIQIRALDYATRAGIQKYPALVVYKPSTGVPFVNVTWLGMTGVVTGMNSAGIAMSEIGDDWDKEHDNLDGRPLTSVMRDAVQFGRTLDEAISEVKRGPRTTSLLYCLTSGKESQTRALQTSRAEVRVYDPSTLPFKTRTGLVFMSMGMSSKWNPKVGAWLDRSYGKLDVAAAQAMMRELHTGSLHAVVFKPASLDLWVANANDLFMGYERPYNHLNLRQALADSFFSSR